MIYIAIIAGKYRLRFLFSFVIDAGGDTVILRAPPLVIRSAADIKRDPEFAWCGGVNSTAGNKKKNILNWLYKVYI